MIKIIKWIFYYSGFEYIYRKINPAKEPQPLPTFMLWLIAVYIASFGVASQRYENRVDIIENKANSIYMQLASGDPVTKGMAFRRIQKIQEMKCPYKPDIRNFITIVRSFWNDTRYEGVANLMKETIENWKGDLWNVDLSGVDLKGCNLERANLRGAHLEGANLSGANLEGVNIDLGDLSKVKTLYKAKLDPLLMEQVKANYPHLLEEPK